MLMTSSRGRRVVLVSHRTQYVLHRCLCVVIRLSNGCMTSYYGKIEIGIVLHANVWLMRTPTLFPFLFYHFKGGCVIPLARGATRGPLDPLVIITFGSYAMRHHLTRCQACAAHP